MQVFAESGEELGGSLRLRLRAATLMLDAVLLADHLVGPVSLQVEIL